MPTGTLYDVRIVVDGQEVHRITGETSYARPGRTVDDAIRTAQSLCTENKWDAEIWSLRDDGYWNMYTKKWTEPGALLVIRAARAYLDRVDLEAD